MRALPGRLLRLNVRLTDRDGLRLDQALSDDPVIIELGRDHLVGRADAALVGTYIGATVRVEVPAREAFGERDEGLVVRVPLASLPAAPPPRVGAIYAASPRPARVVSLDGDHAVLDANDPLAGRDVVVVMDVLDIELRASPEP